MGRRAGESGQASPEYVGVVLLVAVTLAAGLALAGASVPGVGLARALAAKLTCVVAAAGACGPEQSRPQSPLERAYGEELAALLVERVPEIGFEDGDFVSLPVDFRTCRERRCADSIRLGALKATQTGLPLVAFTRVIDCRRPPRDPPPDAPDCSGEGSGNVYLHYWLYYPDSSTSPFGRVGGYHLDDWESLQLRIGPGGEALARASSHHGYNGLRGDPINDTGRFGLDPGWAPYLGALHVAAGSHAGIAAPRDGDTRSIRGEDLVLIPLEPLVRAGGLPDFAVTPPWSKPVWRDPEARGT